MSLPLLVRDSMSSMTSCLAQVVVAAILVCVTVSAQSQETGDPYSKTFDDFQWEENEERFPIPGSLPLGGMLPTEALIQNFEQRIEKNPQDISNLTILGQLYLRHAKEADDLEAYTKASNALERALEIRPDFETAKLHLAEVYSARHRFEEALILASDVRKQNPKSNIAIAFAFDCELELGRYEDAKRSIDELAKREQSPPVLARQAHLSEITGDRDRAIVLIDTALTSLDELGALPDEVKWYLWRKGNLLLSCGRAEEAKQFFARVIDIDPKDDASNTGLAQAQHACGETEAAIKTIQVVVDEFDAPPAMALLGDYHSAMGNHEIAEQWYQKTEAKMREELIVAGDAHAREVALFFADHNRNISEALSLATSDFDQRQDLYAHDTLAWCQYRAGNFEAAYVNIQIALKPGANDANLFYHAALICEKTGRQADAERWRKRMKEANPLFAPPLETLANTDQK